MSEKPRDEARIVFAGTYDNPRTRLAQPVRIVRYRSSPRSAPQLLVEVLEGLDGLGNERWLDAPFDEVRCVVLELAIVQLTDGAKLEPKPSIAKADDATAQARILALLHERVRQQWQMAQIRDELGLTDGQTKGALRRLKLAGAIMSRQDEKGRSFWSLPSVGLPFEHEPSNGNGVASTSPAPAPPELA